MKKLFITLVLLISFSFLGNVVKADIVEIDMDSVAENQTIVGCNTIDTLKLFNSQYPDPYGWAYNSILYENSPYILVTPNSITYSEDGTNWTTDIINSNGYWTLANYGGVGGSQHFYIYFTDPVSEPWTQVSQAICGSSDTLYAGDYQEGLYYIWSEIGVGVISEGYYPNDTSLIEDHTSDFILKKISGCNTIIDTIHLELTTSNLPNLGNDTTFCGEHVDFVATTSEPYDTYLWSDGSTGQSLHITAPGTYYVTVNNACLTNEVASITATEYFYPQLDLGPDIVACGGDSVILTTGFDYYDQGLGFQYWSNASDSITFAYDDTLIVNSNVNLYVRAEYGNCPMMEDWINVTFTTPYNATDICIATVDTNGFNKVIWDPTYTAGIESYNIYKQDGSTWIQVGNLTLDSIISMGHTLFYDTTTDPNVQATAYAVTAIDTCGNESTLSASHKTVWTYTVPVTGGTLLHRSDYEVSDGSFVVDNYVAFIDSFANGNLVQIGVFNSGNQDYLITNPYPGARYYAGAGLPYTCSGSKSVNDLNGISVSNPIVIIPTGETNINTNLNVSIFPNPSTDIFQFRSNKKIEKIEIINAVGQTILFTNLKEINLKDYPTGVYYAKIYTNNNIVTEKIIKH